MKKIKNLTPLDRRSDEQLREITRAGGVASGVARRRKRDLKATLDMIDEMELPDDLTQTQQIEKAFKIEKPTYRDAVFCALYKKILDGDLRAIELYFRLKGEATGGVEVNMNNQSLTVVWNEKRYGDGIDKEAE